MDPVLPANLAALYAVLANPVTAGIVLSILLEKMPFIENASVANWKKAIACVLVGIAWSLFVTIAGPVGLPASPTAWYTLIATGLAVVFSMNVWHTVVIKGLPGLQTFLLALFKPQTVTITATDPGGASVSKQVVSGGVA